MCALGVINKKKERGDRSSFFYSGAYQITLGLAR